jgi:hypothetical protein
MKKEKAITKNSCRKLFRLIISPFGDIVDWLCSNLRHIG